MYDPFKESMQKNTPAENTDINSTFLDFNTKWLPQLDEDTKTKFGKTIEKGTDITKKAFNLYMYGLALTVLIIILPVLLRLAYEFSTWAFDFVGNIFP